MQGHLEYGPEMLLSEYCRDLKRFSQGQMPDRPLLPQNYLDEAAINAFAVVQRLMQASSDPSTSVEFANAIAACLEFDWQTPAQQLFSSWLSYIADHKSAGASELYPADAFNSMGPVHPTKIHRAFIILPSAADRTVACMRSHRSP